MIVYSQSGGISRKLGGTAGDIKALVPLNEGARAFFIECHSLRSPFSAHRNKCRKGVFYHGKNPKSFNFNRGATSKTMV